MNITDYRQFIAQYYENYNRRTSAGRNRNTDIVGGQDTTSGSGQNATSGGGQNVTVGGQDTTSGSSLNTTVASSQNTASGMPAQTHVHEFQASTKLAEENDERHNHRFAGVTSQVIPLSGGSHKHAILTNTDFFDHHHEVGIETGPAINVGDCKHVHFTRGVTTIDDGHYHDFTFFTLIQSPLLPQNVS